jgi:hypothetical protein
MQKSVYDANNDGVVDVSTLATSVAWTGISGKPATFPPEELAGDIVRAAAYSIQTGGTTGVSATVFGFTSAQGTLGAIMHLSSMPTAS